MLGEDPTQQPSPHSQSPQSQLQSAVTQPNPSTSTTVHQCIIMDNDDVENADDRDDDTGGNDDDDAKFDELSPKKAKNTAITTNFSTKPTTDPFPDTMNNPCSDCIHSINHLLLV